MASKKKSDTTSAMTTARTEEQKAADLAMRARAAELQKVGFAEIAAQLEAGKLGSKIEEAELVEQEELEGIPFFITMFQEHAGDYGADSSFVSVTCLLADNSQVVFNDGSTGVKQTLIGDAEKGIAGVTADMLPMYCQGGLRASRYNYIDKNTGEEKPAITWYLSGRPPKKTRGAAAVNGRGQVNLPVT